MSNTIEVIEVIEDSAEAKEIILAPAKAEGYMAWYSSNANGPHCWNQAFEFTDSAVIRDQYRCPYPLFPTRELAIATCARYLPQGGICKLVRITF